MSVYPTDEMPYICEMCEEHQLKPPPYLWVPEDSEPLRICKKCAINRQE